MSRRLRTTRLVLEPQTARTARAVVEGADTGFRPAPGYPHADTVDGLRLLAEHAADTDTGGDEEVGGWFIVLAAERLVIGDCGTKGGPDERGRIEIGYGLAPAYRGQGYGSEAVAAVVSWLGSQPGVRVVTAEVEVGNIASRRLLERLGFVLEDTAGGSWWLALRLGSPP